MPAWEPVSTAQEQDLWSDATRQFESLPAEEARGWPNFKGLAPFITYKLRSWASMDPHLANRWAVGVMRTCQPQGKRIAAVNWDQEPWWLDVHPPEALEDWDRSLWLLSLEDYSVFLSRELGSGMFCGARDQTLTIFGEAFLKAIRLDPPPFVEAVLL